MKKPFFLISVMICTLLARDNPFSYNKTKEGVTTNSSTSTSDFVAQELVLPENTRAIRKISVVIVRDDGVEETVEKRFDRALNCSHIKKLILSQDNNRAVQKNKTASLRIENSGEGIILITENDLKNQFVVGNPPKLVLDFAKEGKLNEMLKASHPLVESIAIGDHKTFFRIAMTLKDGVKAYIKPNTKGYFVTFEK